MLPSSISGVIMRRLLAVRRAGGPVTTCRAWTSPASGRCRQNAIRKIPECGRTPEAALETLMRGWCHIGSITEVRSYGFTSDVWFHVDSAEVRLARLP
jgi:hypothetical protein